MVSPIPTPRAEGVTGTTSVPLYWREDGAPDAPPILLLHGGPGAHHDYLYPQLLRLTATHRVVTYDQRGGGRSRTDDPTPITWATHVADLHALVRELALDGATLVGYSWGALLALLTLIDESQRQEPCTWSRVVLISPAPITRAWRDQFERTLAERQQGTSIQAMRAGLAASGLRDSDPAAYRQRSFELSVAGYFADPTRAVDLTPFRVTGKVQQSVWASLGDFDLTAALQTVAATMHPDVLVVHGRQDPIPLASAEATAAALQAPCTILEACGHVPYVEQPDALFEVIGRFLSTGHSAQPSR